MVKGKKVAISPPEMAASIVPRPKLRASTQCGGDAHQLGSGPVVGHGADGLARSGAVEKEVEQRRHQHRGQGGQEPGPGQGDRSQLNAAQAEVHVARRSGKDRRGDADDDHVHRKGGQQCGQVGGIDHPVDGDP